MRATRFDVPLIGALEVALIVKGLDDPTAAANLIEQYAQTIAAAARLDGVEATIRRFDQALEAGSRT